jgi:hypothetical protein
VVTDQIVSDKGKETIATKLLTAGTDKPMASAILCLDPKAFPGDCPMSIVCVIVTQIR